MPSDVLRSVKERTLFSVVEWGTAQLAAHGFEDARRNVELLLSHILGISPGRLYGIQGRGVSQDELDHFVRLLQRRLSHEPVQYITGEAEFMGIPLSVNNHVLIPRPETELLVEKTLLIVDDIRKQKIHVLDIGTGSGNIPIALRVFAPSVTVTSIDVSEPALEVAAANIARHRISSVALVHADVWTDFLIGERFDIIVSNPPYVSTEDFSLLEPEVRVFEPPMATTDGADGLSLIRRIVELSKTKLHAGGWLLMELSYNQSGDVVGILQKNGFSDMKLWDDYQGIPRIIQARLPSPVGTTG